MAYLDRGHGGTLHLVLCGPKDMACLIKCTCPLTEDKLVALPAMKPNVAIIHCQMSDAHGNAILEGQLCVDEKLARASEKVIISTERVVNTDDIVEHGRGRVSITQLDVNAVARDS